MTAIFSRKSSTTAGKNSRPWQPDAVVYGAGRGGSSIGRWPWYQTADIDMMHGIGRRP